MIDRPFGRTTGSDDAVNGYTSGPIPKHDVTRDIEDLVHGMTSRPRHESYNRRKRLIQSSAVCRLGHSLLGHGAARLRRRHPELPPPGVPGSAILGGAAGIGKTSLVRHIANQTGQDWLRAGDPLQTTRALTSARLDVVPDIPDGSPSCQLIRVVRNTQLPARVRRAFGRPR